MKTDPFSHGFAATATLLFAVIVLSGALVGLLRIPDASSALMPQVKLLTVPAVAVPGDLLAPAVLKVSVGPSAVAIAPAWQGAVTAVDVAIGDEIAEGAIVLRVNGVGRIISSGDLPYWRPLNIGDRGEDVDALRQFLLRLGFKVSTHTSGTPLDADLMRGIRQLATHLGVPDGARVATFDPAWTIFMSRSGTIEEVATNTGEPAPSAGSKLLVLAGPVTEASISTAAAGIQPGKVRLPGGEELSIIDGLVGAGDFRLIQRYTAARPSSIETGSGAAATEIQDGGTARVNEIKLDVTASYPLPTNTVVAPASSLIARSDGTACVVVMTEGEVLSPLTVNVVWSRVEESAVYLTGVDIGQRVVAAPIESSVRRTCEAT